MDGIPDDISGLVATLQGSKCWYVSCGGSAGSTFQLVCGHKIPRETPLSNFGHPEEYRHFQGESSILVWCAWRLDAASGPVTSWDDSQAKVEQYLNELIGSHIESFSIIPAAWDLTLTFSNGMILRVFCDHVPGDPSFDSNWELWVRNVSCVFGAGSKYQIDNSHI